MSTPVRVLELRSVRGTGGGPEKTILLGAARSGRSDVAVTVCYIRDQRDRVFAIDDRARQNAIDYVEIRERHSLDPTIWGPLCRLIDQRRIDVVHAHDYKTDLIAWLLARRTGVVPLSTAHGWTGDSFRERRVYYPLDKRLLATFPRVIAVSSDVKDDLVAHGADPARVKVVLNGIDPAKFRRDPCRVGRCRAELGASRSDIVLAAVGRLAPQKRFDVLLDAVAELRSHWPQLRVFVAGEGDQRPALEARMKALDLGESVRLLGHVDDVSALHHAADLFVQSAEYEGTPNAVLEAMALGVPVVATDAGGTRELLRDRVEGLVVPIRDAAALAKAISEVLEHPGDAMSRTRAARARIESDLSFGMRMRRVEAVYAELARARG
jgi:glycosyltransferase involved in cell wall biosynthesis